MVIRLVAFCLGGPVASLLVQRGNSLLQSGHFLYPIAHQYWQCSHFFVGQLETKYIGTVHINNIWYTHALYVILEHFNLKSQLLTDRHGMFTHDLCYQIL